jgi:phosphoenolpyruvate-protein kinase (PTS system EI component)
MVPLLLGLGVDELSAGAARVGQLRAQIRSLSLEDCRAALGSGVATR